MNNLKFRKGGASLRNLKRLLCLLLVLTMIVPSALAADIIVPDSGGISPGAGGGGSGTKWSSPTNLGPGMLLHVQSSERTVTFEYPDKATKAVSKGYDEVVKYWTTHFPNTDPDSKQTGIYLLPTWIKSNYNQSAIQFKKNGTLEYSYSPVYYIKMGSTTKNINNQLGKNAYNKAAESLKNNSNPNYVLPANYWQNLLNNSTLQSQCASIVTQLFSAKDTSFGYSDDDANNITRRVLYYLGESKGKNDWLPESTGGKNLTDAQIDVGKFMNYCGFLATVIATLPASERAARAAELDHMCQDFLGGKGYTPMVVTGEIVIPTEYNNDTSWSVWWTPQQALHAVTQQNWPDDVSNMWNPKTKVDIITQIGMRRGYDSKGATTMFGKPTASGWTQYKGKGFSLPILGNVISSVSQSTINHYKVDGKPIRGFGVWGLSSAPPAPPIVTPPTPVQITAMGEVGVLVEEKKYQKDVGGYSQTFNATVTVSLGADYAIGTDASVASEQRMKQEGAGIANTLRWLQARRNEGQNIPDPTISIWLVQAEAIKAMDDSKSSYLIDETLGYFGDGEEPTPNYEGKQVIPNQVEGSLGSGFTWKLVPASSLVFKDRNIPGMTVGTGEGGSLQITFTDLNKCADYFTTHDDTLVFVGEYAGSGILDDESAKNQHWFRVGARVKYYGPSSLEDMNTATEVNVGLHTNPKYDYSTITAMPEEDPYYYSKYQRPYSELKQGTVPETGGGSSEQFNSMTGTPTFTDTSTRVDFKGTGYENSGRYYQYFASGGSEFVVQFDGKYVESANASRTYTATFSNVLCDLNGTVPHTESGDPPSPDGSQHCSTCGPHYVGHTYKWEQSVKGFSYVKITNLKVWKLSEAKLDGTRELLDTDEVTATVKTTAPSLSYNIAGADNAAEGRLIYSWETKQKDTVTIPGYPKESDNSCSGYKDTNQKTLDGDTAGITCSATCVSDFIVLRTSNGDQSVLYYEYKSKNEAAINKGNCVADPIEFDKVPYEVIWKSNSKTSEGCSLPEDGITYGGYNGNYASMSTKYKSSGHASNIDFDSTEVYKNKSEMSGSWDAVTEKPTQKFRLMNDTLVIPDAKQNGEYIVGNSSVFYENIVDFGKETPNFPIVPQKDFGGRKGFVVKTTYSPSHDKINDVVVYNPVSNQNAIVVSLPKERDQRVSTHVTTEVDKSTQCPGDSSCPYLKNVCTVTQHVHTEECYHQISYEVHGPNNVHEHTAECRPSTCEGQPCMSTGRHDSRRCPYGHICDGCNPCHNCRDNGGGGGWYVTHGSGCSHEGETHFTTSRSECTTCGHTCGGTYTPAYTCNNLPLNKHVCGAVSSMPIDLSAGFTEASTESGYYNGWRNTGVWEVVAEGPDYNVYAQVRIGSAVSSDSTFQISYNQIKDSDVPSRHSGTFQVGYGTSAGDFVVLHSTSSLGRGSITVSVPKGNYLKVKQFKYGSYYRMHTQILSVSGSLGGSSVKCYTMYKSILSCNDPHHAYSYNWKLYTYGLKHESGAICSGRGCSDNTNLIFPTQEKYTVAQCAAGYIVKHANGDVHLTTQQGVCTYCGSSYKELLSSAQDMDREPDPSEYECYTYGDTRCWAPCNNPENHNKYTTTITDNGTTYGMGDFINLDWPFTIYFPNTGDFYGTGAKWSSTTSSERGWGYINGMDATEWTKCKWVEFPFAVVYDNQTYLPYERIYLEVPKTIFEFYVPLHDSEMANAEVRFGSVAINAQNGEELECGMNKNHNIENITYAGKPKAHHHNADKRTYIDVVGRIGNLALNDTGDFRFSNLFKTPLSEWLVQNIVKKVDPTKQNYIMLDGVDVRKVPITDTGVTGNTHNTRPERGSLSKILNFPLTPAKNNIEPLQRQPIRIGYDSYFDLTTLGNYYGNQFFDEDGTVAGTNLVLIKPHYYRLNLDTGEYKPVDVYMDVNGNYVLINDNDSSTVPYNGSDANVSLNWVEEKDRRNYSGSEVTNSEAVAQANNWVQLPKGSSWVYGNYNILNLTQRNRTFVGSEWTYNDKDDWNSHKDPSDRLPNVQAAMQGQRWHFNVGLPSSAVFVYSGQQPTQANIDACSSGNAVVFCALEIYAQGEVWTLAYDGSNINVPFTVTPGGKTYDPVVPYPDPSKNPKGEKMPIVTIISINHSSKEDVNVIGTQ